jgi:hypothetical protein
MWETEGCIIERYGLSWRRILGLFRQAKEVFDSVATDFGVYRGNQQAGNMGHKPFKLDEETD